MKKFNTNTSILENISHLLAKSIVSCEVLRNCVVGAADRMVRGKTGTIETFTAEGKDAGSRSCVVKVPLIQSQFLF